MTTPYEAYNRGAIALAEHFDIGRVPASDFVLDHNPYPKDENAGWTLFKPSDDLDYEALDGREAKLVHRDGVEAKLVNRDRVEVTLTMRRDTSSVQPASAPPAWDAPDCLVAAFFAAWRGQSGWSLYIKGDLPTKRVTADTLEFSTCFAGVLPSGKSESKLICIMGHDGNSLTYSIAGNASFNSSEVEVTEVYGIGTFQKPTKEEA